MKLGRNDVCRCGSGQKYKKCCLPQDEAARAAELAAKAQTSAVAADEIEVSSEAPPTTAKPPTARTQSAASRRAVIPVAHRLPRRGAV